MMRQVIKVAGSSDLPDTHCPIPLEVIPNYMGISLCSVESVSWGKQDDGHLVYLTIKFNQA